MKTKQRIIFFAIIAELLSCSSQGSGSAVWKFPPAVTGVCTMAEAGAEYGGPKMGKLLITEIGFQFSITSNWIEIHNGTNSELSLENYSLRVSQTWSTTYNNYGGQKTFALPARKIPAGAYFIIRAKSTSTKSDHGYLLSLVGSDTYFPFWTFDGFVEILQNGSTVDYVSFGNNSVQPTTPGAWSGANSAALVSSASQSFRRSAAESDTNSAADWSQASGITPYLPNSTACASDTDADGLPDCIEAPGTAYMGLPYYAWGARTNQRDMFIELEYMDQTSPQCTTCPDIGLAPDETSLQKMTEVYRKRGITAHFDVGDLFDKDGFTGNNLNRFDMCNAGTIPFMKGITFSKPAPAGVNNLWDVAAAHMDARRKNIFYYVVYIFADNAAGTLPSYAGLGSVGASGVAMSLAQRGYKNTSAAGYTNVHSTVLFHELGHNLGLLHGGNVSNNNKPNYLSTMNYLYTYSLPVVGANSGAVYYSSKTACSGIHKPKLDHYTSESPNTYAIDYSDGSGADLDENAILESIGLGRPGGSFVDYNCNGLNDGSPYVLNLDDNAALTVIKDFNDWAAVQIYSAGLGGANPWSSINAIAALEFGEGPPRRAEKVLTPHVLNRYHKSLPDLAVDQFVGSDERVGGVARGRDGTLYAIPAGSGMHIWMDPDAEKYLEVQE